MKNNSGDRESVLFMDEDNYPSIEQLNHLNLAQLRVRYREVFGEEARTGHRLHLVRRIAWRLQVQALGDLSERARQRALEIANDADLKTQVPAHWKGGGPPAPGRSPRPSDQRRIPPPGSLLQRVYQDQTVVVKVLADGFEHEGQRYASLSAVARAVTGTRWNGLLFFGLTQRRKGKGH
ncbi:MAG TPA: DUF2924 domain-containing protein, partial [Terriglobales bacterium]|nr:DUF2924 domain-containing protein [Terriglobales bacterium]